MRWINSIILAATTALLVLGGLSAADAQCAALPYTLSNGQPADATQVMANFNRLFNCVETPTALPLNGPGGGGVSIQNPSATAHYDFNLPATVGVVGALLTSGGGGARAQT